MKIGLCVAGPKGAALAAGLVKMIKPEFIVSYRQNGSSCRFSEIESIAQEVGVDFLSRTEFDEKMASSVDLVFLAGWQFLICHSSERLVVFHDSLLPKYRGFSPTVAALINGEKEIGVTALRPLAAMDTGPILLQKSLAVRYPVKVVDVYKQVGELYVEMAVEIARCLPEATAQREEAASYSMWRDANDYLIDWSWSSEKIKRFVDAVGFPYGGARTNYDGNLIVVHDVRIEPSPNFVEIYPGKVWNIIDNQPAVVSGDGLVRITASALIDGSEFTFEKIRVRLN